jgi:hypothetical protein
MYEEGNMAQWFSGTLEEKIMHDEKRYERTTESLRIIRYIATIKPDKEQLPIVCVKTRHGKLYTGYKENNSIVSGRSIDEV